MKWTTTFFAAVLFAVGAAGTVSAQERKVKPYHDVLAGKCAACHGESAPATVDKLLCAKCHGSPAEMAQTTAALTVRNPHTSIHFGTSLLCEECHKEHRPSYNYCTEACHRTWPNGPGPPALTSWARRQEEFAVERLSSRRHAEQRPAPPPGAAWSAAGDSRLAYTCAMDTDIDALFDNNRRWAERINAREPGFFTRLAQQQSPRYMWIGCADSRVPANEITGLDPGEVFVHRNVANVVVHSDLNALSTIQFAVEHLKVEHIIVVGHYGCAGVRAALHGTRVGLADNWLRHVQDVRLRHRKRLQHLSPQEQEDILCEMNVIEQVGNVALSTVVQDAWARGQVVAVHGWVYGLKDGLLKNLHVTMDRPDTVVEVFAAALKRYPRVASGSEDE
jgi:carbonic anhydrase